MNKLRFDQIASANRFRLLHPEFRDARDEAMSELIHEIERLQEMLKKQNISAREMADLRDDLDTARAEYEKERTERLLAEHRYDALLADCTCSASKDDDGSHDEREGYDG